MNEVQRKKSLAASKKDGLFWSINEGLGDRYLNAFAVILGASPIQIGFLMSIPQFIGSLCQFLSIKFLDTYKVRKKIITRSVFLQALTRIPVLFIPFFIPEQYRIGVLTLSIVLYYALGNLASPAWNSLMGDLVEIDKRGRYFASRNRIMAITVFIAIVVGGLILELFDQSDILIGYAILFFFAMMARLVSGYYLTKMSDPPYQYEKKDAFSFGHYVFFLRKTNHGLFVLHWVFMLFSVAVAGPYFAPYMLRDLGFNYLQFLGVSTVGAIAAYLAMPHIGGLSDIHGNKRVLTISSIFISLIPFVWILSINYWVLIILNFVAGMAWGGFNIACANFVFETVKPSKRARVFAYIAVLNAFAVIIGSAFGGIVAQMEITTAALSSIYFAPFLLSGLFRSIVSAILIPQYKEVRKVKSIKSYELFTSFLIGAPFQGLKYEIFTGFNRGVLSVKKGIDLSIYGLEKGYSSISKHMPKKPNTK